MRLVLTGEKKDQGESVGTEVVAPLWPETRRAGEPDKSTEAATTTSSRSEPALKPAKRSRSM